jgi:hypothetical protein
MTFFVTRIRRIDDTRDRLIRLLSAGATLLLGAPILSGCSLVLPHPEKALPDQGIEQCSLDTLQYRRELPTKITAQGTAVPMIVRHVPPGPDRLLRNGQSIYFNDTHPHASVSNNQDLGDRIMISLNPLIAPKDSSVWILDAVEKESGAAPADSFLSNRVVIRLRTSTGDYLRVVNGQLSTSSSINNASHFVVYKIDVPDSTRRTSCDEQLRDGDFVFLEALEPSLWLDSSSDGTLHGATESGSNGAECVQERQRCYTDDRGGLVCAWAPKCSF